MECRKAHKCRTKARERRRDGPQVDMAATVRGLLDTSFVLCGPKGETRPPVEVTGQPISAQDVGAGVGSLTSGPQSSLGRGGCLCRQCWLVREGDTARGGLCRRPGPWSGAPKAPS